MKKNIVFIISFFVTLLTSQVNSEIAYVRINQSCDEEETHKKKRLRKAEETLKESCKDYIKTFKKDSTMAVVASGGGLRATVVTLAVLQALEKLNLLDAVTYMAGVSGGAWCIGSWIAHNCSLKELEEKLKKSVCTYSQETKKSTFFEMIMEMGAAIAAAATQKEYTSITEIIKKHFGNYNITKLLIALFYGVLKIQTSSQRKPRPYNLVDCWGDFISKKILKIKEQYLSDLAESVSEGNYPIPLLTGVFPLNKADGPIKNYQWMTFSPFKTEIPFLKSWIPASATGVPFKAGKTKYPLGSPYTQESLHYLLGVSGAAFALNSEDILHNTSSEFFEETPPEQIHSLLKQAINLLSIFLTSQIKDLKDEDRLVSPFIRNFLYTMQAHKFSVPIQKSLLTKKRLPIVDAGVSNNIPFPPLLEKNVDIYIAISSRPDNDEKRSPLVRAAQYAKLHNHPFPQFDYKKIKNKALSIIHDQTNPAAPLIIYIQNQIQLSTLKLDFKTEEFEELIRTMHETVSHHERAIKKAIGSKISSAKASLFERGVDKVRSMFNNLVDRVRGFLRR